MQIFLTGSNGYIGGAAAVALIRAGHRVRGLVRDRTKADAVAAHGVEPVIGTLDDAGLLREEACAADAVVNAASSDHRGAIEALLAGLAGSGKAFIHSSGSSVVADLAMGEPSDRVFHEADPIAPLADRAARVAIDRLVLGAPGTHEVRAVVLCNSMIYGHALGPPAQSVQIPALVRQAKASGVARYIGRGLNRWSNVHIADVAGLYLSPSTRRRRAPSCMSKAARKLWARSPNPSQRVSISVPRNPGRPTKRSQPGAAPRRSIRSALTAASGAKSPPRSAGRRRGAPSRSGLRRS